ncbi:unnamed protein product [Sphagnum troendelagicum]
MAGEQKGGGYYPEGHYGTFQGPPPFVQQPQTADPERGSYYPPIADYPRVAEGVPLSGNYGYHQGGHHERHRRRRCCRHRQDPNGLPFCGLGYGWFLFLLGFVFIGVPWYVGTFIFCCLTHDYRERSGLAACAIAAIVVLLLGGSFHLRYM